MERQRYSSWVLERIGIGDVTRLREGSTKIFRLEAANRLPPDRESNYEVLAIDSSYCSRNHCEIHVNGEDIELTDFESRNGTFINGELFCNITVKLNNNDIIGIGCNVSEERCLADPNCFMYTIRRKPLFMSKESLSRKSKRSVDNRSSGEPTGLPQPSRSGTSKISGNLKQNITSSALSTTSKADGNCKKKSVDIEEEDSEDDVMIRKNTPRRRSRIIFSSSSSSDNDDKRTHENNIRKDIGKNNETKKVSLSLPKEFQPIVRLQKSDHIPKTHFGSNSCSSIAHNLTEDVVRKTGSSKSSTNSTTSKKIDSLGSNIADNEECVSSSKTCNVASGSMEEIIVLDSDDDIEINDVKPDKIMHTEDDFILGGMSKVKTNTIHIANQGQISKRESSEKIASVASKTVNESRINESITTKEVNISLENEKKDVQRKKSFNQESERNSHAGRLQKVSSRVEPVIAEETCTTHESTLTRIKQPTSNNPSMKRKSANSDEVNIRRKLVRSNDQPEKNPNLSINESVRTSENPLKTQIKETIASDNKGNNKTKSDTSKWNLQDEDFCALLNIVDEIKAEPIADPNEILEISDDENIEMQLSQHFINDIKREVGNFELEEQFNYPTDMETIDCVTGHGLQPQSPMFEDDDQGIEDDTLNDIDSKWIMKLSQTPVVKIKAEPCEIESEKVNFEEIEEPNEIASNLQKDRGTELRRSEPHAHAETPKAETSWQKEISNDRQLNKTKSKIGYSKLKNPEIISAPSLPIHRGKLRGVSAVSSSAKLMKAITERRASKFRATERQLQYDAEMKQKWLQKPAIERENQKKKRVEIQSNRKEKLRKIADAQAVKRKREDEDDDVKVVNKVKVKITEKNRGAFLTESTITEKPSKMRKEKPSAGKCSLPMNNTSMTVANSEPSTSKDACSKSETKIIDTVSALKIKTRISRIYSSTNDRESTCIEQVNNFLIKEDINTNDEQKVNKSANLTKNTNTFLFDNNLKEKSRSVQTGKLKSILKGCNSSTSISKPKKKVQFCEKLHDIVYFQIEDNISLGRKVDCKDIKIDMQKFLQNFEKKSHYNLVDYSEKILTDILHWDPVKLEKRKELFDNEHKLLPMVHKFSSMDHFVKTVFPLMKMELWATLQSDFDNLKDIPYVLFKIQSSFKEKRGEYDRLVCIFDCLTYSNSFPCNVGDLGIIHAKSHKKETKLFAFVKNIIKMSSPNVNHWQITLDMKNSFTLKDIVDNVKEVRYKTISQIKVELGTFNAVYNLNSSPLKNMILSPIDTGKNNQISADKLTYRGYDELNEGQKLSLLRTYTKVINKENSNICLIEGPPGTGKSHVISNLALQILYGEGRASSLQKKLLICAQSNTAIDVIAQKLLRIRLKMGTNKFHLIRFGILERMHPHVQPISVQNLVRQYLITRAVNRGKDIIEQEKSILNARLTALSVNRKGNCVAEEEIKTLKKRLETLGKIQNPVINSADIEKEYPRFLDGAHIVCTTLASCIKLLQYTKMFDICIIDEATQCSEPWSLIPLQFGISSLVLVGDTQQLPATLLSKKTGKYEYGRSLFTRIKNCLETNPENTIESLCTQYRMHPSICQWPNSYFYNNRLMNGDCTTDFQLQIKPYSILNLEYEQNDNKNGHISNSLEAQFIISLLKSIFPLVQPQFYTFGIITPYAEHRATLCKVLKEHGITDIPVNTIDSYQGKEKDVIIISNARTKGTGFLVNSQRLNVALTRAKKVLILCGNFLSLEKIPAWKSLLNDAKKRNVFYHVSKSDAMNFNEKILPKIRQ